MDLNSHLTVMQHFRKKLKLNIHEPILAESNIVTIQYHTEHK